MRRVVEPLRAMGATIDGRDDGAFAPLVIRGGALHGMRHELPVASAQVKSALMLAGLQADGHDRDRVAGGEPRSHRTHARRARRAGRGRRHAACACAPARPKPFELEVPGDPSSAAFFVVGALITPGSDLTIESLALNPTRLGFVDVLRRMGADIEIDETGERCGEPVGEIARARERARRDRRSKATRSRTSRTRSPRSRSRPRSPTA